MAFRLRRRVRRPDPPVKIVMGDALMEELAERIEQRLIERARPETLACDNCFAICDATHPVMIGEGAKLGAFTIATRRQLRGATSTAHGSKWTWR